MTGHDRGYAKHDLGVCQVLEPESLGPPGQRHFRLRAAAERGSALLWLEKEELYELALTVKRVLRTGVRESHHPSTEGATPDIGADFDFKVAGLALAHDRDSGRYLLLAQMSDDEEDAVALWVERDTLNRMADRAFEVHSAGRPRCPLCHGAMTEGERHVCPRAN